jgi:CubicO group peptidase (beta-lactamase class C family)
MSSLSRTRHCRTVLVAIVAVIALWGPRIGGQAGGQAAQASLEARIDKLFARFTAATPGCAVGVSSGGTVVLEKAYGMADLERDAANLPDTIFEAGSVSKQFTAAAVLLLAREGKLSLDDPARKYVPELPDYGVPLTIRHMLNHTSGLRDWGNVAGLAGWPRTTRVYTHAHVLDIVSRQRALNFPPGSSWSYSNTGFNLAAVIVSRVSGQPFAEFTRTRIFEPLGMTRTSWRDDHTRVVKGRAIAYTEGRDGAHINMPFENVHGNGGLLTTVGDLLRWNENFVEPKVGDAGFVREEQQRGRYSDGGEHDYALGLFIGSYKGLREVYHSGSTAGYQAFLTRYPDQRVSVAVLCNVSSGAAGRYAREVADLYLADALKPEAQPTPARVSPEELKARAGLWVKMSTGELLSLVQEKEALRVESGAALVPATSSRFLLGGGRVLEFEGADVATVTFANGTVERYRRARAATPTPAQLAEYAGTYVSDEAEVTLKLVVEGGQLKAQRRPATTFTLRPVYVDGFSAPLGAIRFHRRAGRVIEMSVGMDRVWDMRFRRVTTPRTAS